MSRLRYTDVPLAWTFVTVALAGAILSIAAGGSAAADNTVVKRFSNGTTHNSVGIVDASEDAPQDGPQAIYAADDGGLYLLDQVNGRILRFDARTPGAPVQSLELPEQIRPTDLVVRHGSVYVWDGAPQALLPTGRDDWPLADASTPQLVSPFSSRSTASPSGAAEPRQQVAFIHNRKEPSPMPRAWNRLPGRIHLVLIRQPAGVLRARRNRS